jgi:hypothetical protein
MPVVYNDQPILSSLGPFDIAASLGFCNKMRVEIFSTLACDSFEVSRALGIDRRVVCVPFDGPPAGEICRR